MDVLLKNDSNFAWLLLGKLVYTFVNPVFSTILRGVFLDAPFAGTNSVDVSTLDADADAAGGVVLCVFTAVAAVPCCTLAKKYTLLLLFYFAEC